MNDPDVLDKLIEKAEADLDEMMKLNRGWNGIATVGQMQSVYAMKMLRQHLSRRHDDTIPMATCP